MKTASKIGIATGIAGLLALCAAVFWDTFGLDFYPVPNVTTADAEALIRESRTLIAEVVGTHVVSLPDILARYPTIRRLKPINVIVKDDQVVLVYGAHGRGLYVIHDVQRSLWVYRNEAKNVDGVTCPERLEIP